MLGKSSSFSMSSAKRTLLCLFLLPSFSISVEAENAEFGSPRASTGTFLHLTDIHLDPWYRRDGSSNHACHHGDKSLLLRDAPSYYQRSHLTDPPDSSDEQITASRHRFRKPFVVGRYGSPLSGCDTPLSLANETFRFVRENLDPDFVVITGDNARHDNDGRIPRKWDEIKALNLLAVDYLREAFGKKSGDGWRVPMIPSIGNNDIYPHNRLEYIPRRPNHILDFFAEAWKGMIPKDQVKEFRHGGWFYVEVVPSKLWVVSLNTLYFFHANEYVRDCVKDSAAGSVHLKWLRKRVLQPARKRGVGVILTGHIPPTVLNYHSSCYERFAELSMEYADIIRGQMYGHHNLDHVLFPVLPEDDDDVTSSFTGPSTKAASMLLRENMDASTEDSRIHLIPAYEDRNSLVLQDRANFFEFTSSGSIEISSPTWLQVYWQFLMTQYRAVYDLSHTSSWSNSTALKFGVDHSILPMAIFVSPSVVPAYNPGVRVLHYVHETLFSENLKYGAIVGYTQYYSNLTYWNDETKDSEDSSMRSFTRNDIHNDPINTQQYTGDLHKHPNHKNKHSESQVPPLPPGTYLYSEEYRPSVAYEFGQEGERTPAEVWVHFAGRLSVEDENEEDDDEGLGLKAGRPNDPATRQRKLKKAYAQNMVVQLIGAFGKWAAYLFGKRS
ncbi:Metallo-dependent phosphatase-like protein [Cladochytrium replicatum]|nr:Metallo-dependent phosphatase-like protein [Cladochytrium replicatum]